MYSGARCLRPFCRLRDTWGHQCISVAWVSKVANRSDSATFASREQFKRMSPACHVFGVGIVYLMLSQSVQQSIEEEELVGWRTRHGERRQGSERGEANSGSLVNVSSGAVTETETETEREIDERGKSSKLDFEPRGTTIIITCAERLLAFVELEDVPIRPCVEAFIGRPGLEAR